MVGRQHNEQPRGLARVQMLIALGLISAVVVGTGVALSFERLDVTNDNEWRATLDDLETLERLVDEYAAARGEYPESLDDVVGCTPVDPWGTPYVYERDGELGFTVYSLGSDRRQGTIEDVYLAGRR